MGQFLPQHLSLSFVYHLSYSLVPSLISVSCHLLTPLYNGLCPYAIFSPFLVWHLVTGLLSPAAVPCHLIFPSPTVTAMCMWVRFLWSIPCNCQGIWILPDSVSVWAYEPYSICILPENVQTLPDSSVCLCGKRKRRGE